MSATKIALRILAIFTAFFLAAGTTCNPPSIARTWVNPSAKMHELTKIKIDYNCGQKPIKSYDPLSASLWIIKAYVRCARVDCTWGRAKGILRNSDQIETTFSTFSAVRNMQIYNEGSLLRVSVKINYRDERRKPEFKTYYLHPEGL